MPLDVWRAGCRPSPRRDSGLSAWTAGRRRWMPCGWTRRWISQSLRRTQVGRLPAPAISGRYDEAVACGLEAREVFVSNGDALTTGKVEQNHGNIYFRRDEPREAERYYRAARERFQSVGDPKELARADNNLANVLSIQLKFALPGDTGDRRVPGDGGRRHTEVWTACLHLVPGTVHLPVSRRAELNGRAARLAPARPTQGRPAF
ncbi:MAG: tetratricopeptide repeat protein [Chloroflexia bacterium]